MMNREQLIEYIEENFNADAEYPWKRYPGFCVFRHKKNRKWFALVADIPREKLGLEGDEMIDIVNVKGDPMLIDALTHSKAGCYPAYHMNKVHWLTIALDGSVKDEEIISLLDGSFEMTE